MKAGYCIYFYFHYEEKQNHKKIDSPPTPAITAIFIDQCVIKIKILLEETWGKAKAWMVFVFRNSYLNEKLSINIQKSASTTYRNCL